MNSFPLLGNPGYKYLFVKLWFRIVPFMFGVGFAIVIFECKYIDRLKDGTRPKFKELLDKLRNNPKYYPILSISGLILCTLTVLGLVWDTCGGLETTVDLSNPSMSSNEYL
jgi:hypothetical protein